MQKEIQPELNNCEYVCASCGSKYEILSTKGKNISLDVCANCHPFYIGSTNNVSLKGRAEKMSSKFAAGKQFNTNKKSSTETKKSSSKQKVKDSFKNL